MSATPDDTMAWDFPRWRETIEVGDSRSTKVWDMKIYSYAKEDEYPIFAVVGEKEVLVFRRKLGKRDCFEELQTFTEDKETKEQNYSIAWARDEDGSPLLCIGGETSIIRIINVMTGKVVQTLSGHGGSIQNLTVSPKDAHILVSASDDYTIRVWSLRRVHRDLPCVALLAGEGHINSISSIDFHRSGFYLLSGGFDHRVNLWTIPDISDENLPQKQTNIVHYPHFSSSEIHSGIVDCVLFLNDLVLSKAQGEEKIVLWKITNFSSSVAPPTAQAAPTTHDPKPRTRSSFFKLSDDHKPGPRLYERLLQFEIPGTNQWTRFSLFNPPSPKHPVLAFFDSSKVYFWDFARLLEYQKFITSGGEVPKPQWLTANRKAGNAGTLGRAPREEAVVSGSTNTETLDSLEIEAIRESNDEKYSMTSPWRSLKAHKVETIPEVATVGRQIAWSTNGEFCVVLGTPNIISVLSRWSKTGRDIKSGCSSV